MAKLQATLVAIEKAEANMPKSMECKEILLINRDLTLFLGLPPSNALIKEAGGYILLEDGSKLLLE